MAILALVIFVILGVVFIITIHTWRYKHDLTQYKIKKETEKLMMNNNISMFDQGQEIYQAEEYMKDNDLWSCPLTDTLKDILLRTINEKAFLKVTLKENKDIKTYDLNNVSSVMRNLNENSTGLIEFKYKLSLKKEYSNHAVFFNNKNCYLVHSRLLDIMQGEIKKRTGTELITPLDYDIFKITYLEEIIKMDIERDPNNRN